MNIEKIQLNHAHKNGLISDRCDKVCHIKTLPYITIVQAVEGSYDIKLGNNDTFNTGNAGFFIAPSKIQQTITHHTNKLSGKMNCRWVALKIKINDLYDIDNLYDFPIIIPENFKSEMNSLFNEIFSANNVFDEYIIYHKIIKLLFSLAKVKKQKVSPHIEKAIDYIKSKYQNSISIKTIATQVNLSESRLFSVFKEEVGVSPIAYLNTYRMSLAADLLSNTDKSIAEIASLVGVKDSFYFNKLFRKNFLLSPSKYRKIYKNGKE